MLYAGSDMDKARQVFAAAIKHRQRIRLTIRLPGTTSGERKKSSARL